MMHSKIFGKQKLTFLKYSSSLFLFTLLAFCSIAQVTIKNPDYFLVKNIDSLPSIFLVGSFHFEYYNKDAHKVEKDKQVDILSDKKQQELKQLLDYIALFKPTKICIEAPEKWAAMEKYHLYKAGKKELERDEIQQIAFRLMDRFKLDTVYCVDAKSIADEWPESKDSMVMKPYFDSVFNNYTFKSSVQYNNWIKYDTELGLKIPLLQYFKYYNSQKRFQRDYGFYLTQDFKMVSTKVPMRWPLTGTAGTCAFSGIYSG